MPTHQLETATFVRLSAFRDRTANFEKTFAKVWPTPSYRLLRVPFVGVPHAVIRDRHAGRREARAVPAQGPMQADFFRHQAGIWQAR